MTTVIDPEQVTEWFNNPVTKLFKEVVQEAIASKQSESRFNPFESVDYNALNNARDEGFIQGLVELEDIERVMKGESDEGESDES